MVPELAASILPRKLAAIQMSRLDQMVLNQNISEWGPKSHVLRDVPNDSEMLHNLKSNIIFKNHNHK